MRWPLPNWFKKCGEEISPLLGLSFGALYLAAVAAVGIAAINVQRTELAKQHIEDMEQWTFWFGQHLAQAHKENANALSREIQRASRENGLSFCAIVSPAGNFIAHSDPTQVGKPTGELLWRDGQHDRVRIGHDSAHPTDTVVAARILSPLGETTPNTLWVGLEPVYFAWRQSNIVFWSGYVLLAVLGLYLFAYRLLRRAVKPLAVIRRRLLGVSPQAEMAERLVALRLNDSFDEISKSWNRLIEFVADCQDQLRRSRLTSDVTAAMDGYRSERLTNILMQIPFGVLVVDGDGMISFANRAASRLLGASGEPLEGTPASNVFDEAVCMTLLSSHGSGKGGNSALSRWTDHTFERPHGNVTLRFWSITCDASDKEHILFAQDITQAKEAERARDQFLYHVTHELRTPLTNIRAYAETLSQGVVEDEQTIRECYNVIMGETQRLNRLVEDILNVSQLEVGSARLDIGEVQLDRLLRSVVQDTQGQADGKNIDLVLNLPAKMPQVRGDKERLTVVLTNLVGNAIKYTLSGGRVDVRCASETGRVRIAVTDTGIGIKKEDQERIFDKFYRVDDERVRAVPGTGLGLSIVKETIRLHGGTIMVENSSDQGTTFIMTLPAVVLDDAAPNKKQKAIARDQTSAAKPQEPEKTITETGHQESAPGANALAHP